MRPFQIIEILLILAFFPASGHDPKEANTDKRLIDKVARWQISHLTDTFADNHWTRAAFYRGLAEWADYSRSKEFNRVLLRTGKRLQWDLLPRTYDADDLCISQMYIKLYEKYRDPGMILKATDRVHSVMSRPKFMGLNIAPPGKYNRERWGWCDALFMAPPVYASLAGILNEPELLDFALSEYKVTTDSLFDTDEKLYYRDLRWVRAKEPDGKRLFWGRGNGWVYAGLAFMLDNTPRQHPGYKYWMDLFLQMSSSVMATQDNKGSWHTSLLDAGAYPEPENSASGFFVFGLAWGVNHGILKDDVYKSAALKGWNALKNYVGQDGKLGYIQPVGHAPLKNISSEMTMTYGVGAFLLAGTEICRMIIRPER